MKRLLFLLALVFLLCGCAQTPQPAQVAATTAPVYEFTRFLCRGTDISVTGLITENISCLHDYSLSVKQVRAIEGAQLVVLSGAGLEDFMAPLLAEKSTLDSAQGVPLLGCDHHDHHGHDHHGHSHGETDPHIWLSPENAMVMAKNICRALCAQFPGHQATLESNLPQLLQQLQELQDYGKQQLSDLHSRELITFHDGFAYFAEAFDLTILMAVEEESGSEASAEELKQLCNLVWSHNVPAIFTEVSGSISAARVISKETGVPVFTLSMAMSPGSYFDAMRHNIDTIKEALG